MAAIGAIDGGRRADGVVVAVVLLHREHAGRTVAEAVHDVVLARAAGLVGPVLVGVREHGGEGADIAGRVLIGLNGLGRADLVLIAVVLLHREHALRAQEAVGDIVGAGAVGL